MATSTTAPLRVQVSDGCLMLGYHENDDKVEALVELTTKRNRDSASEFNAT